MVNPEAVKKVLATRKFVNVLGTQMSYLDTKDHAETAVVFLHGNPSAAYLWRAVIPHVQGQARCLAPDLVGMGHSEKLKDPTKYHFVVHYTYLSAWIEKMNLPKKFYLVIHDWGSALGFHWANQHRDRVAGIAFMESVVAPFPDMKSWEVDHQKFFGGLRSPAGEEMVIQNNLFVEQFLPGVIIRKLTDEEMNEYRRPYKDVGESRRPTLTWPREIPIESDGSSEVVAIVEDYLKWLQTSHNVPKLYIEGDPGVFTDHMGHIANALPNVKKVVVKGLHFIQEDSPDEIGQFISQFLRDQVTGKKTVKL